MRVYKGEKSTKVLALKAVQSERFLYFVRSMIIEILIMVCNITLYWSYINILNLNVAISFRVLWLRYLIIAWQDICICRVEKTYLFCNAARR